MVAESGTRLTEKLGRGDFVRFAYRLGHGRATGLVTVATPTHDDSLLVLRRGYVVSTEADALGRQAARRLEQIASYQQGVAHFEGGVAAYPPGRGGRGLHLVSWCKQHLEAQLDSHRANLLLAELAGARLVAIAERLPPAALCSAADQRIFEALAQPRRLDQIWPLARTPRFKLLTTIHFLRSVGAIRLSGVVVADRGLPSTGQQSAMRALGITDASDRAAVKRAYWRLARALHPDLHPTASATRRRHLEAQLAEINSAYRRLTEAS